MIKKKFIIQKILSILKLNFLCFKDNLSDFLWNENGILIFIGHENTELRLGQDF